MSYLDEKDKKGMKNMAIWQFSFIIVPKTEETSPKKILKESIWEDDKIPEVIDRHLSSFLPIQKSWSPDIIQYGEIDGTCIEIFYFKRKPDEISCRLDIRNINKNTIRNVIKFIELISGEIYYSGQKYPADCEILMNLIKNSDAYKFCINPKRFFDTK